MSDGHAAEYPAHQVVAPGNDVGSDHPRNSLGRTMPVKRLRQGFGALRSVRASFLSEIPPLERAACARRRHPKRALFEPLPSPGR